MSRFSLLNDWLSRLETLHSTPIELGLSRVKLVAQKLSIPARIPAPTQVIMVAGTNGKGSFVATLQALLLSKGCSVGAFTSPHIIDYNERIQIDGVNQSDAAICDAFARIDKARGEISLTYFEFGALAAMLLFQDQVLDYWILEVGLGGRLDAVNIIDADIAVITSIGIDHVQWLGDTRELIAIEKAGIIKTQSVVVCSELDLPSTLATQLENHERPVYKIGHDFSYAISDNNLTLSVASEDVFCTLPRLPLPSVAAAAQVYNLLESDLTCKGPVIASLSLGGRFEEHIYRDVHIILDVAHNPAATQHLAQRLGAQGNDKYIILLAVMSDKNISETVRPLMPIAAHWVCTEIHGLTRCESSTLLKDAVKSAKQEKGSQLHVESDRHFEGAFSRCIQLASERELSILVLGSFHTVAEARQLLA